jgi:hypothetical protein
MLELMLLLFDRTWTASYPRVATTAKAPSISPMAPIASQFIFTSSLSKEILHQN